MQCAVCRPEAVNGPGVPDCHKISIKVQAPHHIDQMASSPESRHSTGSANQIGHQLRRGPCERPPITAITVDDRCWIQGGYARHVSLSQALCARPGIPRFYSTLFSIRSASWCGNSVCRRWKRRAGSWEGKIPVCSQPGDRNTPHRGQLPLKSSPHSPTSRLLVYHRSVQEVRVVRNRQAQRVSPFQSRIAC